MTNPHSDNPYETPIAANIKVKSPLWRLLSIIALVCAIVLVFFAILLPFRRDARPASLSMACSNNMRQLGRALLDYEQRYGEFPPAYTIDANGQRLHSWRTLILPFIDGGGPLYQKLDLSRPWDDPVNDRVRKVSAKDFDCLDAFGCPSSKLPQGFTTYVAIVAPGSCLQPGKGRKVSEIKDGLDHTIFVCEANLDQAVHWMSPEDISPDMLLQSNEQSKSIHSSRRHALFGDCSVRLLGNYIDAGTLRAHVTIDGGESIPQRID